VCGFIKEIARATEIDPHFVPVPTGDTRDVAHNVMYGQVVKLSDPGVSHRVCDNVVPSILFFVL